MLCTSQGRSDELNWRSMSSRPVRTFSAPVPKPNLGVRSEESDGHWFLMLDASALCEEDGCKAASVAVKHHRQRFDRDAKGGAAGTRIFGVEACKSRFVTILRMVLVSIVQVKSILNKFPGK